MLSDCKEDLFAGKLALAKNSGELLLVWEYSLKQYTIGQRRKFLLDEVPFIVTIDQLKRGVGC